MQKENSLTEPQEQFFILEQPISIEKIEERITDIIKHKQLLKDQHPFFNAARLYSALDTKQINVKAAFEIARHWELMTKTFMFTTLSSLGVLSQQLAKTNSCPFGILSALQTGVKVISDDLNNNHPAFAKVAPKGSNGIHYQWWSTEIVFPIAEKLSLTSWSALPSSENISALLAGMHLLANKPFGFAIQLRLVEAIALEIAIAFRYVFSSTFHEGKRIFETRNQLAWITSHIMAEVNHHNDVSDMEAGMSSIAATFQEQQDFLITMEWYAELWFKALYDFYNFLSLD